jgi:hypothetical protein
MSKNPSLEDTLVIEEPGHRGTSRQKEYNHTPNAEEEVDIWDLVKIVWDGRMVIVICALVFLGFGVFHVTNGPTEYVSDAVLLQETAGGSSSASGAQRLLQSFGGDFGFSQPRETGRIPPSLYPTIIQSVAFQYDLIFEEVEFSRFEEPLSFYEFFNNHYETPFRDEVYRFIRSYTIGFPQRVADWIINFSLFDEEEAEIEEEVIVDLDDRLLSLSREEHRPISQLSTRITLTLDGNLITVETRMPDRKAAAMLNVLVIERIQEYVTDYQIEKAKQNVDFIQRQKEQAMERYEESQRALAEFRDQNINLATNVARTEEERLSNQRNLTFNIYNSISVELEQAQLRLQEETPIFSVMQKSSLPTASLGSSNRVLAIYLILGGFIGFAFVFGVKIYEKIETEVIQKKG